MPSNLVVPDSGQFKHPTTASTATAFVLTSGPGRYTGAFLNSVNLPVFALGPNTAGADIVFGGSGNNNSSYVCRIYTAHSAFTPRTTDPSQWEQQDYDLRLYGVATATLSSAAPALGATTLNLSNLVADTLAFQKGDATTDSPFLGVHDFIKTVYGVNDAQVVSPAADYQAAKLMCPHFGWATGLVLDFDMTGASSGFTLINRT